MNFLTIIAWIFGVLATLLLILRIIGALCYDERAKLLDNLKGVERAFPVAIPGTIAIVCWAWIISGGIK